MTTRKSRIWNPRRSLYTHLLFPIVDSPSLSGFILPYSARSILVIALMLILSPLMVHGELCPVSSITEPCRIVSPFISNTTNCNTSSYRIIETSNGSIFVRGNMTPLTDGIYYFNLTNIVTGSYLIELCDNTTREITMTSPITYIANPDEAFIYTGFDISSTAGILTLIFLFAIFVAFVCFGIYAKSRGTGWILTLAGIYGICFSIFLALTMSIIFGGILALISVMLIIFGFI